MVAEEGARVQAAARARRRKGGKSAMLSMLLALVLSALAAPLPTAAGAQENTGSRPMDEDRVRGIVRDYLLQNPELIIESLRLYQQRQAQAEMAQTGALAAVRARLDDPTGRFVGGNPDGDVTIVEFFDYRCGYCKTVMPALLDVVARDGNVRLVFKEFPVLGEASALASRAAIAAARQNRYYDMHLALMRMRETPTPETLRALAGVLGLDAARMARDMRRPETDAEIAVNRELAQLLNIRGTPGFVIGDELVRGAIDAETFHALIDKARKSGG